MDDWADPDRCVRVNFQADRHFWRMWDKTALELALQLVPDLERWIDLARKKGEDITIDVKVGD
jgi:hypothetical protein